MSRPDDLAKAPIYFKGYLSDQGALSNVYLNIQNVESNGINLEGTTLLRILTAGVYYFEAQKLMQPSGGVYFHSMHNGITRHHGYHAANDLIDLKTSFVMYLNVNDYIQVYLTNAVSNSWLGNHSTVNLIKLK